LLLQKATRRADYAITAEYALASLLDKVEAWPKSLTGASAQAVNAYSLMGAPTVTSPGFAAAQVRPCASQATILCGEEANAA
jgi:hypothetical protein